MIPEQGEIWWAESLEKRRPVLVVTRSAAVPVLEWVTIVPITTRVRGIPTELPVGEADGLARDGVAPFDNIQPIRRPFLTERVGSLGPRGRLAICRALEALADC